jgi:hypothetical protein
MNSHRRSNSPTKLLVSLLLILSHLSACASGANHPADEALLSNFRSHRADFERLLQMFLADKGLGRVAPDFTRPDAPQSVGVAPERISEYRNLFKKLGLTAGIEGYEEKDHVWFHASTYGLAVTGSSKGYAHLKQRPALVVGSLDSYRHRDSRSFVVFRHIEGDWYLYFDYED